MTCLTTQALTSRTTLPTPCIWAEKEWKVAQVQMCLGHSWINHNQKKVWCRYPYTRRTHQILPSGAVIEWKAVAIQDLTWVITLTYSKWKVLAQNLTKWVRQVETRNSTMLVSINNHQISQIKRRISSRNHHQSPETADLVLLSTSSLLHLLSKVCSRTSLKPLIGQER